MRKQLYPGDCILIHQKQTDQKNPPFFLHYPGLRIKASNKFSTKSEILVVLLDNTPKLMVIKTFGNGHEYFLLERKFKLINLQKEKSVSSSK